MCHLGKQHLKWQQPIAAVHFVPATQKSAEPTADLEHHCARVRLKISVHSSSHQLAWMLTRTHRNMHLNLWCASQVQSAGQEQQYSRGELNKQLAGSMLI